MDTDVLIVGAGPTGLMLANQLVRRGVRVLLVDRHAGPSRQTRALGVQARTLEIYARLGIVDRALALGTPGRGANLWAQGRRTARVPLGDAGRDVTPYPYILILGQDDNERILGERLRGVGGAVSWNTELTGFVQRPDHVEATLKQPDGTARTVRAAWVAGCDGAHSAVREGNGIAFEGAAYEHVFFVADVQAGGTMVEGEVNVYLWRSGFHLFFPMRGREHWRIVGIVPAELRERDGLDMAAVTPSLLQEAGAGLAIQGCTWFSTYRIHHRRAARFGDRRCFLLGDAAHVHSPVGAQGMNTGLQDAYNLAWKLALVVQGRADAALLESYEAERLPVARRLLETTDRAFRLIVADNPLAGLMRTRVLARLAAFAMRQPAAQALAFRTVSQIGIHYRDSALSHTLAPRPEPALQAGDRFPWLRLCLQPGGPVTDLFEQLDDTRFTLLRFAAPDAAPEPDTGPAWRRLSGLLHTLAVPSDPANDDALRHAGIAAPSFYLLRPDGHVGLCGTHVDTAAIERYAAERLGLK